jgi:hypothetical protein
LKVINIPKYEGNHIKTDVGFLNEQPFDYIVMLSIVISSAVAGNDVTDP